MAVTADLSDPIERRKAASAAKARIGKAIKFVGENAIQLHGGMGVVDEYMISHFFKRATMIGILFGNVDFHMKRYIEHHIYQVFDYLLILNLFVHIF